MKLYGNLNNRLMEGPTAIKPELGMGATLLAYSDRHAATVIKIVGTGFDGPSVIWVQLDTCTRTDGNGMSECQDYSYSPNPNGRIEYFKRDQKNRWRQAYISKRGRYCFTNGGNGLRLDSRDAYHDYSF